MARACPECAMPQLPYQTECAFCEAVLRTSEEAETGRKIWEGMPEAERRSAEADYRKKYEAFASRYQRLTPARKMLDAALTGLVFLWIPALTIWSKTLGPRILAGAVGFLAAAGATLWFHSLGGARMLAMVVFVGLYGAEFILFAAFLSKPDGWDFIPFVIGVMAAPLVGVLAGLYVMRSYRLASDSE